MSCQRECQVVETNGYWFYILENTSAPKNAWDWREYAQAYGPFGSREIAMAHLDRFHSNPGGCTLIGYNPQDNVLVQLLKEAKK